MNDLEELAAPARSAEHVLNRRAVITMLVGFGLLIVSFVVAVVAFRVNQNSDQWVEHTYDVTQSLAEVEILIERIGTSSRGYLLVPDAGRAQTFWQNRGNILPHVEEVRRLTADNPRQQRNVVELENLIRGEFATTDAIMMLATHDRLAQARQLFAATVGRRQVQAIRAKTHEMRLEETLKLAERKDRERSTTLVVEVFLGVVTVIIIALALGTMALVRRFIRDLTASRDSLRRLNSGLEDAVRDRTADVTRANEEIQRFAYIVSHDLRSPLVNVMGFTAELETANGDVARFVEKVAAERPGLVTERVRLAVVEDLPEAIGFIRSSTQKMDRLINAILALSRQGRRVLSPEQLDMDRVLEDIRSSLAIIAAERNATIRIDRPLPAVSHDRLVIDQLFSNLLENATKYLAPGRPGDIVVRGTVANGRARFEVSDNGRGIDPHDHERIFELFRRSGAQDQTGEGIGLAHVRALAYRVGGTVTVRSILGEGSTFIVDLPAQAVAERDPQ